MTEPGAVQFINPPTLNKNPAFTNVVVVTGSVKTVYVGGQDSVGGVWHHRWQGGLRKAD